jgi:FkbM family methyltransferase
MDREQRIKIAQQCHDSDVIPKVLNAGEIIQDDTSRPYQLMHNGLKVYTDSHYGDFVTKIIESLRGHHEPQEERVFYEVLKVIPEGGNMLELGSFWAYYSMWFATTIPNSHNYMVEPLPEVLQNGIDNFKLNNLTGDFTAACVGKETLAKTPFKHWDDKTYEIPQISIDNFLIEKGIETLNILHSDIQGAEFDMLKGAQKSLKDGKIKFLFISTHSEELHFECMNLLKGNNYKILSEHTLSESFSTDGLIVAVHSSLNFPTIKVSRRFNFTGFKTRLKYFFKRR